VRPPEPEQAEVSFEFSLDPAGESNTSHIIDVVVNNRSSTVFREPSFLALELWEEGIWTPVALLPQQGAGPPIPDACTPSPTGEDCPSDTGERAVEAGESGELRRFRIASLQPGTYRVVSLAENEQASSSPYVEVT